MSRIHYYCLSKTMHYLWTTLISWWPIEISIFSFHLLSLVLLPSSKAIQPRHTHTMTYTHANQHSVETIDGIDIHIFSHSNRWCNFAHSIGSSYSQHYTHSTLSDGNFSLGQKSRRAFMYHITHFIIIIMIQPIFYFAFIYLLRCHWKFRNN